MYREIEGASESLQNDRSGVCPIVMQASYHKNWNWNSGRRSAAGQTSLRPPDQAPGASESWALPHRAAQRKILGHPFPLPSAPPKETSREIHGHQADGSRPTARR